MKLTINNVAYDIFVSDVGLYTTLYWKQYDVVPGLMLTFKVAEEKGEAWEVQGEKYTEKNKFTPVLKAIAASLKGVLAKTEGLGCSYGRTPGTAPNESFITIQGSESKSALANLDKFYPDYNFVGTKFEKRARLTTLFNHPRVKNKLEADAYARHLTLSKQSNLNWTTLNSDDAVKLYDVLKQNDLVLLSKDEFLNKVKILNQKSLAEITGKEIPEEKVAQCEVGCRIC